MSNPFATAESSSMSSTEPLQPMAFSQAGMPGSAAAPMGMGQGGAAGQPQQGVLFFHLAFKAGALFTYMFLSGLGLSYMLTFVFVVVLSALDFWTVKNVSGRLLVGLRWSNHIDDAGKSTWHFQSFEDQRAINQTDSNIFWLGLFLPMAMWTIIAFGCILTLRFMWLLLVSVALALNAINVIGYVKCKRDAGRKLSSLGGSVLTKGLQAWSGAQARMASSGGGGGYGGPPAV